MALTIKDLEKFQTEHPDHRLELVDGGIVVMSPSGYEAEAENLLHADGEAALQFADGYGIYAHHGKSPFDHW